MVKNGKGVSIINKSIHERNIDVIYPQLKMLKNKTHRTKINEFIMNTVNYLIKEQIGDDNDKNISIRYQIKLNKGSLLSIVFEICNFIKGKNEIFTTSRSITFDLRNTVSLRFKDLFIENSYYEYIIDKIITDNIETNQTPFIQEFFNKDKNKFFYLTEGFLVIYFPLYRDTNYANFYCIPEYFIPYDNIKGFLNPHSPILKISKVKVKQKSRIKWIFHLILDFYTKNYEKVFFQKFRYWHNN